MLLILSVWHNNQCVTSALKTSEFTPQSIFYGRVYSNQSECFHLVKVQPTTQSWITGRGHSLLHTYTKVSFNDAWLVRYISKGPARNWCHVTAIDMIGCRNPNLDPEIFCCKVWSKIFSKLNKHEIRQEYVILNQRGLHTKLQKTSISAFALLPSSWRYHVSDFFG